MRITNQYRGFHSLICQSQVWESASVSSWHSSLYSTSDLNCLKTKKLIYHYQWPSLHITYSSDEHSHFGILLAQTTMASDDDEDLAHSTIFQEPEGYFKPEKASTYAEYTMLSGQILRLRLVGHSPLWV